MALFQVTAPTLEPVTLDEAKTHLRVDIDDDNGLIDTLITAAREQVESYTRRALMPQTWDLKLDDFPCDGDAVWLPMPPVTSVTSITYTDMNGVAGNVWSATKYTTDLPTGPKAQRARIAPAFAQIYPVTYPDLNVIAIRFVCGYAKEAAVPARIRQAMLLLIGTWYQNREQVLISQFAGQFLELPVGVTSLLYSYRAW